MWSGKWSGVDDVVVSGHLDASGPTVSPPGISSSSATSRHKPWSCRSYLQLQWLADSFDLMCPLSLPTRQHDRVSKCVVLPCPCTISKGVARDICGMSVMRKRVKRDPWGLNPVSIDAEQQQTCHSPTVPRLEYGEARVHPSAQFAASGIASRGCMKQKVAAGRHRRKGVPEDRSGATAERRQAKKVTKEGRLSVRSVRPVRESQSETRKKRSTVTGLIGTQGKAEMALGITDSCR